jgi:hypothetical protein
MMMMNVIVWWRCWTIATRWWWTIGRDLSWWVINRDWRWWTVTRRWMMMMVSMMRIVVM